MRWIFYAMGTAVILALADFLVKQASGKLSNSLALFIFGSCTFLVGLSWLAWQKYQGVVHFAQPAGILAAMGVGFSFSFVTLGLYVTFGAGAPISLASPVVRVGGMLLASVAGLIILQEPFTWRYAAGVLLACSGIYLILTR